jgi:hypothetical protein
MHFYRFFFGFGHLCNTTSDQNLCLDFIKDFWIFRKELFGVFATLT